MANEPIVLSDDMKVSGDTRWLRREEFNTFMDNWFQPVELYIAGTPLIANVTYTNLGWDAEHFDPFGLHDNAVNNSRITIAKAGKYFVHTVVKWDFNTTGTRFVFILVNGTINIGLEQEGKSFDQLMIVQRQFNLAVGDYLQVQVYQSSGGNLIVRGAGQYNSFFGAFRTGN